MVASFLGVPGVRGVGLPFAQRTSADSSPAPVLTTSSSEPTTSTAPAVIAPPTPLDATAAVVDVGLVDQPPVGEVSAVVADPPAAPAPLGDGSPTTVATVFVQRAPTTNPPRPATTGPTTTATATAAPSVGPKGTRAGSSGEVGQVGFAIGNGTRPRVKRARGPPRQVSR